MDSLNWGKCVLGVSWKEEGDESATVKLFPVAAEDTTELSVDEGDEVEATIEGGEVEAVRYTANKYNLAAAIRTLSTRKKPLKDSNGRLTGSGSVFLVPEDVSSDLGIYIENSNGKMVDSFTAADGGKFTYTFKALKASSGNMVKWGHFAFVKTDGKNITNIETLIANISSVSTIVFTETVSESETQPASIVIKHP